MIDIDIDIDINISKLFNFLNFIWYNIIWLIANCNILLINNKSNVLKYINNILDINYELNK